MSVSAITSTSSVAYAQQIQAASVRNDGDGDDTASAPVATAGNAAVRPDSDTDDRVNSALARSTASVQAALASLKTGG